MVTALATPRAEVVDSPSGADGAAHRGEDAIVTGPTDHPPARAAGDRGPGGGPPRPALGVTLLVLGAVPTAAGAALLTVTLTSAPNLATGIVQAAALVSLVVGLLLAGLAAGPMSDTYRRGGRTTFLVAVAALVAGFVTGIVS